MAARLRKFPEEVRRASAEDLALMATFLGGKYDAEASRDEERWACMMAQAWNLGGGKPRRTVKFYMTRRKPKRNVKAMQAELLAWAGSTRGLK